MPSSSTRSTYTELNLVYFYRIAFSRLWSSGMHVQCDFITTEFAEILDIAKHELMRALRPVYVPGNRVGWKNDIKHWNELQTSNAKLKTSSRINAAGNALADVGAELFRVGRADEAGRFCEFGAALWRVSQAEWEEEQRAKDDGYSYSDVEMD